MSALSTPLKQDDPSHSLPLTSNQILAALPDEELERIRPLLEVRSHPLKDVLLHPHVPIRYVYFPLDGICSLINMDDDGGQLEVGIIGREGVVGHAVLMGKTTMIHQCISQIPLVAARMGVEDLRAHARQSDHFQPQILRFIQSLLDQTTQVSACNRLHSVEERLGRWILMCDDRIHADHLLLTQEFLSVMLGVRRPTVTLAVGMLQSAGLIRTSRGQITIMDRAGLEESSCECYRIIRENATLPL